MSKVQNINKNETKSQLLSHPAIQGWVAIRNDGTQNVASDEIAERFGEVLIYFNQITELIGETFGLEKLDEIHIVCDELTAVCMPGRKETVGILFDKDTNPNEFLAKYKTAKS